MKGSNIQHWHVDRRVVLTCLAVFMTLGMLSGYAIANVTADEPRIVYVNQTVEKDCIAEIVHEDMRVEYLKQKIRNTEYVFEE